MTQKDYNKSTDAKFVKYESNAERNKAKRLRKKKK